MTTPTTGAASAAPPSAQLHAGGAFVDGRWREAPRRARLPVLSPSTGEPIGTVAVAGADDVDATVAAAGRALAAGPWPALTPAERLGLLRAVRARIATKVEELARLQTAEMGAPIRSTRAGGARRGVALMDAYFEAAGEVAFEQWRDDADGPTVVYREPVGVVAAIIPFNAPVSFALDKLTAALLAGCTVVLKPDPQTPFDAAVIADVLAACGLPAGVLGIVNGGAGVGEQLVRHEAVAKVSFTGSTAAGRHIGAACAERFARVNLELGGKSPALVLDDADLEDATATIAAANFTHTGQVCYALSRVLVPRHRARAFVDALADRARAVVVGDPFDDATEMGPLVSERQRARVEAHVAAGVAAGARVVAGGGRPAGRDRGWYVQPTVLADVGNGMAVAREEIFGPVMSVICYGDEDEAVRIANDTPYGLHGAVFTRDVARGLAIARRVAAGTLAINGWGVRAAPPFGGVKASGIGREHGLAGLESFLEYKAVAVPPTPAPGAGGRSPARDGRGGQR